MVSKSKKLGKSPLILVSVGSTSFPFARLSNYFIGKKTGEYRVSHGFGSPNRLIESIRSANKIIIHGGPATLFLVVKYSKYMPLVIPRQKKYREHVDDHQLFFVEYLKDRLPANLKRYFVTEEKIDKIIDGYLNEKNKVNGLRKFLFLNKKKFIADKLSEYLSFSFP